MKVSKLKQFYKIYNTTNKFFERYYYAEPYVKSFVNYAVNAKSNNKASRHYFESLIGAMPYIQKLTPIAFKLLVDLAKEGFLIDITIIFDKMFGIRRSYEKLLNREI